VRQNFDLQPVHHSLELHQFRRASAVHGQGVSQLPELDASRKRNFDKTSPGKIPRLLHEHFQMSGH